MAILPETLTFVFYFLGLLLVMKMTYASQVTLTSELFSEEAQKMMKMTQIVGVFLFVLTFLYQLAYFGHVYWRL